MIAVRVLWIVHDDRLASICLGLELWGNIVASRIALVNLKVLLEPSAEELAEDEVLRDML